MTRVEWAIVAMIIGIVATLGYITYAEIQVKRICYSAGYSAVRGGVSSGWYCIKRVDQTDIVVPIEKVTK